MTPPGVSAIDPCTYGDHGRIDAVGLNRQDIVAIPKRVYPITWLKRNVAWRHNLGRAVAVVARRM